MKYGDINNCKYLEDKELIKVCKLKLDICLDDDCFLNKARFEQDEQLCYNINVNLIKI